MHTFETFSVPHYYTTPKGRIRVSQGCYYFIHQGKAPWIFDIIHAAQRHRMVAKKSFQAWKLSRDSFGMRTLTLLDENGELLFAADGLKDDDFLLNTLEIYFSSGCCILKSEYRFFE